MRFWRPWERCVPVCVGCIRTAAESEIAALLSAVQFETGTWGRCLGDRTPGSARAAIGTSRARDGTHQNARVCGEPIDAAPRVRRRAAGGRATCLFLTFFCVAVTAVTVLSIHNLAPPRPFRRTATTTTHTLALSALANWLVSNRIVPLGRTAQSSLDLGLSDWRKSTSKETGTTIL